jgi:hypothetical protein
MLKKINHDNEKIAKIQVTANHIILYLCQTRLNGLCGPIFFGKYYGIYKTAS